MKQGKGFSLIELLIAITIVGIIVSVAIPSYNSIMLETRRSDALTALSNRAMLQERFYTTNNAYSNSMADLGGAISDEGFYNIAVDTSACANSCFTLTATPIAGEAQDSDDTCWTIRITHTGQKSSSTSGGVANAARTCW